jgi:hypothetical protein
VICDGILEILEGVSLHDCCMLQMRDDMCLETGKTGDSSQRRGCELLVECDVRD